MSILPFNLLLQEEGSFGEIVNSGVAPEDVNVRGLLVTLLCEVSRIEVSHFKLTPTHSRGCKNATIVALNLEYDRHYATGKRVLAVKDGQVLAASYLPASWNQRAAGQRNCCEPHLLDMIWEARIVDCPSLFLLQGVHIRFDMSSVIFQGVL